MKRVIATTLSTLLISGSALYAKEYNTPQKKTNQKMLKYKKHQKRG